MLTEKFQIQNFNINLNSGFYSGNTEYTENTILPQYKNRITSLLNVLLIGKYYSYYFFIEKSMKIYTFIFDVSSILKNFG